MSVCNLSLITVVTFRATDANEKRQAIDFCDTFARVHPLADVYTQTINGLTQIVMIREVI